MPLRSALYATNEGSMGLTRRQFLSLTAFSAAGVAVNKGRSLFWGGLGSTEDDLLVQSPVLMPEDLVTGLDNWYASLCQECSAACGIVARVMEGRVKKLEGNPRYPVNRGKLCVVGQAALQSLYDPDRLQGPLRRKGDRGKGDFQEITWDEALGELT